MEGGSKGERERGREGGRGKGGRDRLKRGREGGIEEERGREGVEVE